MKQNTLYNYDAIYGEKKKTFLDSLDLSYRSQYRSV